MDKYKESFALEFAKVMQKNGQRWSTSQKKSIRNLYTKWVLAYIGGFIAGFIPLKREWLNYDLNFHIILAIICFIGAIFAAIPIYRRTGTQPAEQGAVKYLSKNMAAY